MSFFALFTNPILNFVLFFLKNIKLGVVMMYFFAV